MRCDEIETFIYPYLDDEFGEAERAEFEAHLTVCESCRRRVEMESWVIQQLRAEATRLPAAPESLRRRIHLQLGQVKGTSSRWLPQRMPGYIWKPLPLVAGLGALAFFLWPMMGSSLDPVVQELVARHQNDTAVDVAGPEPSRLNRFYSSRLPFAIQLPRFAASQSTLLGGRVVRLWNQPSAHVVYDIDGEKLSLIAFQSNGIHGFTDPRSLPDRHWVVQGAAGYNVAIYRSSGVTYGLTSRMERPKLEQIVQRASFSP